MLFTILAVLVFVFGFFCWWKYDDWFDDGWLFGAITSWVIGGVCVIVAIIAIITAAAQDGIVTENLIAQREAIEYRLEQCEEDTNVMINGGVYDDLVEYNAEVRRHRRWTYDLWVGWFYSDGPAELEYIELPNKGS